MNNHKIVTTTIRTTNLPAANSTFAIGGVLLSADSLMVAESFVLRINICGKNPANRKSAKRWNQLTYNALKTNIKYKAIEKPISLAGN